MSAKKSEKRKNEVLTIDEKYVALQRLGGDVSAAQSASEHGVGTSTVSDWKKNRPEIEKWYTSRPSSSNSKKQSKKRKSMKKSQHEQVSDALFVWFVQKREKGAPISGPILKEKALEFYNRFEGNNDETVKDINDESKKSFVASEGWLDTGKDGMEFEN